MGCKASKSNQKLHSIAFAFEHVRVSQLDAFFDKASALLEKAEIIRKRFIDSAQEVYQLTGAYQLRTGRYLQSIRVLFWATSAQFQGQILRSGLKIIDGPPFVSLGVNSLSDENKAIYISLRAHLEVSVEGPELLKDEIFRLSQMKNELVRIENQISAKKYSKIAGPLSRNAKLFYSEFAKTKTLYHTILKTKENINKMIPKMRNIAKKADEIGIKAYSQGILQPLEIFDHFIITNKKKGQNNLFLNIEEMELNESIHEDERDEENIDDLEAGDADNLDMNMQTNQSKNLSVSPRKASANNTTQEDKEVNNTKPKKSSLNTSFGLETTQDKKRKESFTLKLQPLPKTKTGSFLQDPQENVSTANPYTIDNANMIDLHSIAKDLKDYASLKPGKSRADNINRPISIALEDGRHVIGNPTYQQAKKIVIDAPEMKNFAVERVATLNDENQFPYYRYSIPVKTAPVNLSLNPSIPQESLLKKSNPEVQMNPLRNENNRTVDDILEELKQMRFQNKQKEEMSLAEYGDENIEEEQETSKNIPIQNSSIITDFSERRQHYLVNMKS